MHYVIYKAKNDFLINDFIYFYLFSKHHINSLSHISKVTVETRKLHNMISVVSLKLFYVHLKNKVHCVRIQNNVKENKNSCILQKSRLLEKM